MLQSYSIERMDSSWPYVSVHEVIAVNGHSDRLLTLRQHFRLDSCR